MSTFLKSSPPIPPSPLSGQNVEVIPAQVKAHAQLAAILSSGSTRELFLQYLKEVLAEENVSFWEHVEAYRQSGGGEAGAKKIVDMFITDGADFEVNIDRSQKMEVFQGLERTPGGPEVFDGVQTQIFHLLAIDRYEKFRRHEIYHAVEALNKPAKKSSLAVNLAILVGPALHPLLLLLRRVSSKISCSALLPCVFVFCLVHSFDEGIPVWIMTMIMIIILSCS